ncbi:hypothetical protein [Lysobacter capsici]|uniref:hypothetical protein n=1 Tax=Lysobacter capsici TaxID=435897 RepID=UPI001C0082E7|nr:hypothetical protein [Lysobacter capsici]QWF16969.1 hypothetical protein KME82_25105 [Lysobacter capsici]
MPEQTPTRPTGAVIGAVSGALIGAFFGRLWLSLATKDLSEWRAGVEIAGWTILGLFVVAGVVVARTALRAPAAQWGGTRPRPGWAAWFVVVIAVEVALIVGGQSLLSGAVGHPEWIPAWALFVVGAHFWPFATILRVDAFRILAGALCAVATASALLAGFTSIASLWAALPGFGGTATLWGFCGWTLYRMAHGRSRDG